MSKSFLRIIACFVLLAAVAGCSSYEKKVIGTWSSKGKDWQIVARFDSDGRYVMEAECCRFSAPYHMEGNTTIVTKGYEYCPTCGEPDVLKFHDRRFKVGFEGDSLILTDIDSGDATRYQRAADNALSWKPRRGPSVVEFEAKK